MNPIFSSILLGFLFAFSLAWQAHCVVKQKKSVFFPYIIKFGALGLFFVVLYISKGNLLYNVALFMGSAVCGLVLSIVARKRVLR